MFNDSPFYKSDYWEMENEWRVCIPIIINDVCYNDESTSNNGETIRLPIKIKKEYLDYKGSQKAFCAVPFEADMIESVRLSPNCDEYIVDIKDLLSSNGFGFMVNSVEYSEADLIKY